MPATPNVTESTPMTPVDGGLFLTVVLLWGSSFLLIDVGLDHLTPPLVAAGRLAAGVGTLALVPSARRRLPRGAWRRTALLGLCWMAAPFLLFSTAQQWIDSSLAGTLNAAAPLFTAVVAAVVVRRLPGRRRRTGLVGGFTGVVLMSLPALQSARTTALGVALVLLATVLYGVAFNLAAPLQRRYGALPVLLRAEACALVALTPYASTGFAGARPELSSIAAVVALGVLGTAVAFVAFVDLAGRVGATRASLTTYLLPLVAAALGVAVRGERLSVWLVVGGSLTIGGAYVASRPEVPPGVDAPSTPETPSPVGAPAR